MPVVELLRLEEVAEQLRISRRQVSRLIKSGEIKTILIGRRRLVYQSFLNAYLERKVQENDR